MTDHPITVRREAPHNLEAEQALLGAILVNNEAHDRVSGFLEPHHFFDPLHQRIYETAAKLIGEGKQATPITLKTFFENAEPIGSGLSVPAYLGQLAVNATTIINVRDYGRATYDLSIRRQLINVGEDMVNAAYDSPVDFPPKEQIEEVEGRLYALAERGDGGNAEVAAAAMQNAALALIQEAYRGTAVALPTGLADLDKYRVLRPGRLVILAGRPSMGKTALATGIIRAQTKTVHFFSAEMSAAEIGLRRLSAETGLPSDYLDGGNLTDADWRKLVAAHEHLSAQDLVVDPTAALTIGQLTTRARRMKRQRRTGLVVVDYIQLLRGVRRTENRNLEVGEITAGLKALAKEIDAPVLALSQLSRNVENRGDKRPHLADLRDFGSIEQDADVVMFVFRPEYYLERERPEGIEDAAKVKLRLEEVRGVAEVIIEKNCNGPVGAAKLQFDAPTAKFSNLACGGQEHP